MLNRGFRDHVPIWPTYLWPLLAQTLIFWVCYYKRRLQLQGVWYFHLYRSPLLQCIYLPIYGLAAVLMPFVMIYSFIIMGGWFIPAALFGLAVMLQVLKYPIGLLPYSHLITPMLFVLVLLSYAVLLNLVRIDAIANWNVTAFLALQGL